MKVILPLLIVLLVLVVLGVLRLRSRRPHHVHDAVDRHEIARTATHFTTDRPATEVLEAVVEEFLSWHPKGRPPRRYHVVRRDARSVEVALRLADHPELAPVCTVLVEAEPAAEVALASLSDTVADAAPRAGAAAGIGAGAPGTTGRLEVLDILEVDRLLDRLKEVQVTRDIVLRSVTRHDPDATFRDELLDLSD